MHLTDSSLEGVVVECVDGCSGTITGCTGSATYNIKSSNVTVAAGLGAGTVHLYVPLSLESANIGTVNLHADGSVLNSTIGTVVLSYAGSPIVQNNTITGYKAIELNEPDGTFSNFSGNIYTHPTPYGYCAGTVDGTVTLSPVEGVINAFYLTGTLAVSPGASLTLGNGMQLGMGLSGYGKTFNVAGNLEATGASLTGLVTTSNLNIQNGGYANLTGCTISGSGRVVIYSGGTVHLTATSSGPQVEFVDGSTGRIECSAFSTLRVSVNADVVAFSNDLSSNSLVATGTGGTINFTHNWWGTTDPLAIEARITDCNDNASLPCVTYDPFLGSVGCVELHDQFWASVENSDAALASIGTYTLRTQSTEMLADLSTRPLLESSDRPDLRYIYATGPDDQVVTDQELLDFLVLLAQSARKTPNVNLGDREWLIHPFDLKEPNLEVTSSLNVEAPDAVARWWLDCFVSVGYWVVPFYWVSGIMWEGHRSDIHAEVILDAVLQPDFADALADDPRLLARLDTCLTLQEVVIPAYLLTALRITGRTAPPDVVWMDLTTLIDRIGQAAGHLNWGKYFTILSTAVSTANKVQTIKADAARHLLLKALADAEADQRLEAIEWAVAQMSGADPALVAGVAAARARFDRVTDEHYQRLAAVLDASTNQGLVEWGMFTAHMVAEFSGLKVVIGGTKVGVGKILLPYSLAWSVNKGIRDQSYEAQRCCLAATLQRQLFNTSVLPSLRAILTGQSPINDQDAKHVAHLLQINGYISYYFYDRYLSIGNNTLSSLMGNVWDILLAGTPYDEFIDDLEESRTAALGEAGLLAGPKYLTTHANPVDTTATDAEYEWLLSLTTTERQDPCIPYVVPLDADFAWAPQPPERGQSVTFAPVVGGLQSYEWDFGDEVTSTETNPIHVFDSYGTFTVRLTVTDRLGHQRMKEMVVRVIEPAPVADFIVETPSIIAGETASFTNATAGTATGWLWVFGDGKTGTTQNPTHQYDHAGSYTVTLLALGPDGQSTKVIPDGVQVSGSTGTVEVTANLAESSFQVMGPAGMVLPGQGQSKSFTEQPPGGYEIQWVPVLGYTTPAPQMLTLQADATILFAGTYTQLAEPDTISPTVVESVPASGGKVYRWSDIVITFSESVRISPSSFWLHDQGDLTYSPSDLNMSAGAGATVNVAFVFAEIPPDGLYTLSVEDSILDMQNNPLDGDGDNQPGGDFLLSLQVQHFFGDADDDEDVDGDDLEYFEGCATGPSISVASGSTFSGLDCTLFDFDSDTDVDQTDFGIFHRCYSGGANPADPSCEE